MNYLQHLISILNYKFKIVIVVLVVGPLVYPIIPIQCYLDQQAPQYHLEEIISMSHNLNGNMYLQVLDNVLGDNNSFGQPQNDTSRPSTPTTTTTTTTNY